MEQYPTQPKARLLMETHALLAHMLPIGYLRQLLLKTTQEYQPGLA